MKAYLERALHAEADIARRMEQIGRLKALQARGRRTLPEDEGGREILRRMQALEAELMGDVLALRGVQKDVENVIARLEKENLRQLLAYRYLCGWDWLRIAGQMNYSLDRIRHLHAEALRTLRRQMRPEAMERR